MVKDLSVAFTIVGTTIYWNQEIFEHYIKTNHGLELINMAMKSIDTGYVSPGKITGKQKERVLVEIRRKKPSDDGSGESKYSKSDPDNTVKSKEEKIKDLQKDNASKQEQFDNIRLLLTEIEKILSLKNEQIKKILEREILERQNLELEREIIKRRILELEREILKKDYGAGLVRRYLTHPELDIKKTNTTLNKLIYKMLELSKEGRVDLHYYYLIFFSNDKIPPVLQNLRRLESFL